MHVINRIAETLNAVHPVVLTFKNYFQAMKMWGNDGCHKLYYNHQSTNREKK